tara:strand:+ start:3449 stop:4801 length:1353 start_codon:yes stop_codon:yes gene_type:complete
MGGGLIQLVSKGAQDVYLTGNPQVTFFKVVYRRYTNFSMECIPQTIDGDVEPGRSIDCHITRDGDLIHRVYFEYENNNQQYYPANFGNYMIQKVDLLIGGQLIDSHPGHWLEVYSRLTQPQYGLNPNMSEKMNHPDRICTPYQQLSASGGVSANKDGSKYQKFRLGKLSVPLAFSFCQNPGLALPLIALQYNEVVLHMEFNPLTNFMSQVQTEHPSETIQNPISSGQSQIWVEYIYLDTDERRRFAQMSHEYLVEQLQYKEAILTRDNFDIDIQFNNSVKELVFACDWNRLKEPGTLPGLGNNLTKVSLTINGNNIFQSDRSLNYFTRNLIYERHEGNPNTFVKSTDGEGSIFHTEDGGTTIDTLGEGTEETKFDVIGVYSFALKPDMHQPTGTFNFSTINGGKLIFKDMCPPKLESSIDAYTESRTLRVYARSYNLLRIMSGMGKLAYI